MNKLFNRVSDRKAELLIYGDIGGQYYGGITARDFIQQLQDLGDVDEIVARINSVGGLIHEGFAIFNALRAHKAEVTTRIEGVAASIASVIALAGDKREIAKNAHFMIHRAWNVCIGHADDMRQTAVTLESMEGKILDIYCAAAASTPREEIFQIMKEETWLPSERALEMGFVQEVYDDDSSTESAMAMTFDLSRFKHPPASLKAKAPNAELAAMAESQRMADEVAVRLRMLDLDEAA
ncbi:head maturation protease, ClpP-related [Lacipirellula sp.]|uniref:head maturation protease, ClpP-related n=1 Tax=Lacipirellula sp. TaxID=2691419 RepID=UPI003D0C3D84